MGYRSRSSSDPDLEELSIRVKRDDFLHPIRQARGIADGLFLYWFRLGKEPTATLVMPQREERDNMARSEMPPDLRGMYFDAISIERALTDIKTGDSVRAWKVTVTCDMTATMEVIALGSDEDEARDNAIEQANDADFNAWELDESSCTDARVEDHDSIEEV